MNRPLEQLRQKFESGDHSALPFAIFHCARDKRALPAWAADAFWDAWLRVSMRRSDWNDEFGATKKKTAGQIERQARDWQLIRLMVKELRSPNKRAAIRRDESGLFAELAAKLGIKARVARELYYDLSPLVRGQSFHKISKKRGGDTGAKRGKNRQPSQPPAGVLPPCTRLADLPPHTSPPPVSR